MRHGSGPPSEQEQAQFEAWIAADVRHRGAYVRLQAIHAEVQRLAAVSVGRDFERGRSVLRLAALGLRRWALAAGLVVLLGGATVSWVALSTRGERYVSDVGEMRRVALLDGSNMTLDTDSETRVRFDNSTRSVQLKRGEALFEVAHDPSRPFIVRAAGMTIRALGTAFAVRIDGSRVKVTVTEGVVELSRNDASGGSTQHSASRRLFANEQATGSGTEHLQVQSLKAAATERSLAWRQGALAFAGEPLGTAVAELNRYSRRHIVIDDPELASQPIVGMFRATDIDSFARTAAAITIARIVEDTDVLKLIPNRANR